MRDVAEHSIRNAKVTFSSDVARQGRKTTSAAKRRGTRAGKESNKAEPQVLNVDTVAPAISLLGRRR
jgi:hypothetical protein